MTTNQAYIGSELEIFAHARQWKEYFKGILSPFLGKRVLEVGAGIGATTLALCDKWQDEWICLETDSDLLARLQTLRLPACCDLQLDFVSTLSHEAYFDYILYIDILDHIEDDCTELELASRHLTPGGKLIVLSPAYQILFSPFDVPIDYCRRYDRDSLLAIDPPASRILILRHIDSIGLLASLSNRIFLQQSLPIYAQILFLDHDLVPLSLWLDQLHGFRFGCSIISVWERK